MKSFVLLSVDAQDDFIDGPEHLVQVESQHDTIEEAIQEYEDKREIISNVYLVQILAQSECI